MPFNEVLKNCSAKPWLIGNSEISGNPVPAIMGILNLTPDSFFDGGLHASHEEGIAFAKKLLEDGANIIDIGGESSRPGAIPVSAKDEIERILPVIKALTAMSLEKPFFISIDTTKTEVAIAALQAGAHIINDVSMQNCDNDGKPLSFLAIKALVKPESSSKTCSSFVSLQKTLLANALKKSRFSMIELFIFNALQTKILINRPSTNCE